VLLKKRPDIERFLAAPGAGVRAAIVHGRDGGVVRERADALAKVSTARPDDPFDTALLVEADLASDEARLEGELAAISMMGGRRLIRLRLSGDKPASLGVAEEALTRHLAGAFNPDAFFLIEAGELRESVGLIKAGKDSPACAIIVCYEDEIGDLARFTREALAKDGLSLAKDALDLFVARLPHERGVARSEIERLALYLGPGSGAVGHADDLTDFFGVEPEASLQAAALDAFGGRMAAAQAGLRRAAQEGESGFAAIRALGIHLGTLRKIAVLQKSGASAQSAAKSARVFWKNEAEVLRQARAWTLTEIDGVQPDILGADVACKQAGAPDHLLAERLALTVAGRARRLGL
jgi:DNA polymerase-3 subunit delta